MQPAILKGYLLALLAITILSPDALLIRLAGNETWLILAWRGVIAGSMILIYNQLLQRRPIWEQIKPAGWWVLGVIVLKAISQFGFVYGIAHANATDVLVIIAFAPLISALLSALFLGEPVKLRTWIATIFCALGLAFLLMQPDSQSDIGGLVAAFICASTLASVFVVIRRFPTANLTPCVGMGGILVGIVCIVVVLLSGGSLSMDQQQTWSVLTIGLIVSPISFVLLALSLRYITAAETSLVMLLESIMGSLWVWAVLSERPTVETVLSGTLIVGTLIIYSYLALRDKG